MTGGLGRIADSDAGVITKLVASANFAYGKNLEGMLRVLALHRTGHPLPESEDCVLSKVHKDGRYCRLGDALHMLGHPLKEAGKCGPSQVHMCRGHC